MRGGVKNWLILAGLVIAALLARGCSSGGGSAGTGGLRVEGTVIASGSSQPLSGLLVTVAQTGDSATTDVSGSFAVDTSSVSGTIELLLERQDLSARTVVEGVPSDASVVALRIRVDVEQQNSEVEEINITRRRGNEGSGGSGGSGGGAGSGGSDDGDDDGDGGSGGHGGDDDGGGGSGGSGGSGGDDDDDDDGSAGSGGGGGSGGSDGAAGNGGNGGEQEFRVTGPITALTASTVTVEGLVFMVNAETDFGSRSSLSEFSVGETVEARGEIIGGILVAERVRLED